MSIKDLKKDFSLISVFERIERLELEIIRKKTDQANLLKLIKEREDYTNIADEDEKSYVDGLDDKYKEYLVEEQEEVVS